MATVVEARSLSNLTTLASNPPQYPRNPIHAKQEPLVLYIARVPGSRDVFLTPMKPREKVVTAEDVQSSLYYLHFDSPDDARLLESNNVLLEHDEHEEPQEAAELPRLVQRKPLPPVPIDQGFGYPSGPVPLQEPVQPHPSSPTRRKPVPSSLLSERKGVMNRANIDASTVSRKSLGYPPSHLRAESANSLFRSQENQNFNPYGWERTAEPSPNEADLEPPPLPPRRPTEELDGDSNAPDPYRGSAVRNSAASHITRYTSSPEWNSSGASTPAQYLDQDELGTSLTLIRRDPASGAQWNISKIRDPPVLEVSSANLRNPSSARSGKEAFAPIYVEITNPGYSKFLHTGEDGASSRPSTSQSLPKDYVFRRRIWMEGVSRPFGHRKTNSTDSYIGLRAHSRGSSEIRSGIEEPTSSGVEGLQLSRETRPASLVPGSELKSSNFRGYVFTSPWNGRCEFSTGGAGRSLKCKHILPGSRNPALSPKVTVSELRFNLPSSSTGSTSLTSAEDGGPVKRSSLFPRPRARRTDSSTLDIGCDLDDGMARLDLSLGQEFAGGGFGGKQAKLGKLIVEDEGLKMLDLIVATNLGIWWRAYERVHGNQQSH